MQTFPETERLAALHGVELKPLLRARDVARLLDVDQATVSRWNRSGRLTALVIGGQLKVELAAIERFIERRGGDS